MWQRPAAWLPQGSAVHSVAEHYGLRKLAGNPMTLEEALDLFNVEYAKEVDSYTEITPNFEYWSRSGPYAGLQDVERRWNLGREQVEKLLAWDAAHPEEVIWVAPDGTPGIELPFEMDLDGIVVRGYIDAIYQTDEGLGYSLPKVRDYKTGKDPGDDFQLAVYGVAIGELDAAQQPTQGDYWMGKSGKATYPFDLTDWPRERVSARFAELEEKIQAGEFPPDPESKKCMFCDVSYSCEFAVG